ncbi:MAG: ATP-binding protein [Bacteroidota bacterium]
MSVLVGRKREINVLQKASKSPKSEFVALYGRRRVGKTFLVREVFQYQFDFQLIGLANATTEQQLLNFHVSLQRTDLSHEHELPTSWFQAFQQLITYLHSVNEDRKKVIFLDELPWLDTPNSDFLMALEHFWNSWATNRKDILLITCGSAASWMIRELIHNHGGLHNRLTQRIQIQPFTLAETEEMLRNRGHVLNRYQILQLYMVMGGIPYYLDALEVGKSAAQNIDALCFQSWGLLAKEFPHLFASLFNQPGSYEQLIRALGTKRKGLTRREIIAATQASSGGRLSQQLVELEESGFVTRYPDFSQIKKETTYRLSDFYSLFFLRFIQNRTAFDPGTWLQSLDHPAIRAWSGYAFEQICLVHIRQLKQALGISGVQSQASTWQSRSTESNAQIDLLIDRRDQVINLCEIKFALHPYSITKSYAQKMRDRTHLFISETETSKAPFLTMITTYGVKQNSHSLGLVQAEVKMDDLFQP